MRINLVETANSLVNATIIRDHLLVVKNIKRLGNELLEVKDIEEIERAKLVVKILSSEFEEAIISLMDQRIKELRELIYLNK